MTTKIRFRTGLALSALLALMLFAGTACSSSTPTASAAEAVRAAGQNSSDAKSVSFEMQLALSGGGSGSSFETEAEGVYDFENSQMQMTMDVMGQEMAAVMDGAVIYTKMPFLGEGWMKQDLEELNGGNPLEVASQDPTQVLTWLQAAGDDVEEVGTDEIRGEEATHYRAALNLEDALEDLEGEEREALERALELLGDDGMEVDVWINGEGLPVRVLYEMSFGNSGIKALDDANIKFSLEFFDWGQPVRIELPDPKDVRGG